MRNDDALFPEFKGQDLRSHAPARLEHRAVEVIGALAARYGQLVAFLPTVMARRSR